MVMFSDSWLQQPIMQSADQLLNAQETTEGEGRTLGEQAMILEDLVDVTVLDKQGMAFI
jgi:hypothetical protein